MSVETGTVYMPYAPASSVLQVIRRMRDGRLPDPLSLGALHQLGVAEGNADRVQKALRFLGLVDEENRRTDVFNRLARVSTEEYPRALAEIVQNAYAPILQIVNPDEDPELAVHDAFRGYDPAGQRVRMVGLFYALCREAEIISGGPVKRTPTPRTRKPAQTSTPRSRAAAENVPVAAIAEAPVSGEDQQLPDYRLIANLIHQLPRDAKWTQARRDRWIQALTASVDLLVEIDEVVP